MGLAATDKKSHIVSKCLKLFIYLRKESPDFPTEFVSTLYKIIKMDGKSASCEIFSELIETIDIQRYMAPVDVFNFIYDITKQMVDSSNRIPALELGNFVSKIK